MRLCRLAACLTFATTLTTPSLTLATSLADIYELAVENDPQIAAARASYKAQSEVVPQARAGLLPSVSASVSTTQTKRTSPEFIEDASAPGGFRVINQTQNFNDNSWSARLTQPVFDLSRWFSFQQSKEIESQAAAQLAARQQELLFRVADNYLSILEAEDRLSAAIAERDAVKRQLEQVQQRFDVGLVAITDVLESAGGVRFIYRRRHRSRGCAGDHIPDSCASDGPDDKRNRRALRGLPREIPGTQR
ncbi:MAG: TolC family protein [Gammaproteobacteria bacterium]|nr:TolC family protein [Gammaproteobacteria bacterium]